MHDIFAFFVIFAHHAGPLLGMVVAWCTLQSMFRVIRYLHVHGMLQAPSPAVTLLQFAGEPVVGSTTGSPAVMEAAEDDADRVIPGWLPVAARHAWPGCLAWGVVYGLHLLRA